MKIGRLIGCCDRKERGKEGDEEKRAAKMKGRGNCTNGKMQAKNRK